MTYTIPFSQLNKSNIPVAGGKGANLGEMTSAGFPVPGGFVLTTAAYNAFVEAHGLQQQIVDLAHTVAADDPHSSEVASEKIKQLFLPTRLATLVMKPARPYRKTMAPGTMSSPVRSTGSISTWARTRRTPITTSIPRNVCASIWRYSKVDRGETSKNS